MTSLVRQRLSVLLVVVAVAGVNAYLLATISRSVQRLYIVESDFRAYYTAGRMLLAGVRSPFYSLTTQYAWQRVSFPELRTLTDLMPFFNPPFVALPFAALATLSVSDAYLAWTAIEIGLLALTMARLLGTCAARRPFASAIVSLTFLPVWLTIRQGQLSIVLLLAFLEAWQALRREQSTRAGIWLAVLLIKPQLVALPVLALLLKRRWRTVVSFLVAGAVLLGVSALLVGGDGLAQYGRLLEEVSHWGNAYAIHPQQMHTLRGFLQRLFHRDDLSTVAGWWLGGVGLLIALLGWIWCQPSGPEDWRFDVQWGITIGVAVLVSPHAYFHDLTVLLLSGLLFWHSLARIPAPGNWRRLLVAVLLIGEVLIDLSVFIGGGRLQTSVLGMLLVIVAFSCCLLWRTRSGPSRGSGMS